ncbi:MAG: hypothetical protein ACM37W_12165 [Actinomycetota bacterium]
MKEVLRVDEGARDNERSLAMPIGLLMLSQGQFFLRLVRCYDQRWPQKVKLNHPWQQLMLAKPCNFEYGELSVIRKPGNFHLSRFSGKQLYKFFSTL